MPASSDAAPSIVGLRSTWTCSLCQCTALSFQIVTVTQPMLATPPGWYVLDGLANCGEHEAVQGEDGFAEGAD